MSIDVAGKNLLIVLTGSLGDVARGLCLVSPLKAAGMAATITWVVEKRWRQLVDLHSQVDRVLEFDRAAGLAGVSGLVCQLKAGQFDITIDLQRNLKSGLISLISGSKIRVAFAPRDSKEFNFLFNNSFIGEFGENISKVEHYLKFLGLFGIEPPSSVYFGLEQLSREQFEIEMLGLPDRYVGLVLGSSWASKDWPTAGYVGLAKMLRQGFSHQIVLMGGSQQAQAAAEISSQVPGCIDLTAKTSIKQLVGVLKYALALVGPDSGPGHIAAALGQKYVTLFGPTNPQRVAPWGSQDLAIANGVGCSPCGRRTCPGLGQVCMRLISPAMVYSKLANLLHGKEMPA